MIKFVMEKYLCLSKFTVVLDIKNWITKLKDIISERAEPSCFQFNNETRNVIKMPFLNSWDEHPYFSNKEESTNWQERCVVTTVMK